MSTEPPCPLPLAEALERAYQLALAVKTLAGEERPAADGEVLSLVAAELLGVLDRARASMLRPVHPHRHNRW